MQYSAVQDARQQQLGAVTAAVRQAGCHWPAGAQKVTAAQFWWLLLQDDSDAVEAAVLQRQPPINQQADVGLRDPLNDSSTSNLRCQSVMYASRHQQTSVEEKELR